MMNMQDGSREKVPRTLEPVAILSAGADDGGALHVLSMIGGDGSGIQRVVWKLE